MKFEIKLNNIEISDIKIGGIEIKSDFSISEMIAMRKETEYVLENITTYMHQLKNACDLSLDYSEDFYNKLHKDNYDNYNYKSSKDILKELETDIAKAIKPYINSNRR